MSDTAFICVTCGVQQAPRVSMPERCPICEDERQYVRQGGQAWTTLGGDTTAIHDLADLISHLAQTEVAFGSGTGQAAVVRAIEVRVAVERDPAEHRARLEKELAEAKESLRRSRELLARPGFAEKAPPNVVASERAKLAEREERVRLLEEELRRGA